jgi:hypothetical protein
MMHPLPPSRLGPLRTSAVLVCLLTLAASGDDFCLVRAVFPAAPTRSSILPLDDPNTDFVEQADSWSDGASRDEGGVDRLAPATAPGAGWVPAKKWKFLPAGATAAHHGGAGIEPPARLRC